MALCTSQPVIGNGISPERVTSLNSPGERLMSPILHRSAGFEMLFDMLRASIDRF